MKKKFIFSILFILSIILLASCAPKPMDLGGNYGESSYVTGLTVSGAEEGENPGFLTINVKEDNQALGIWVRGTLTNGAAALRLKDVDGKVVKEWSLDGVNVSVQDTLEGMKKGEYKLDLYWDGPVMGQLDILSAPGEVRLPKFSGVALLSGAGMILVALAFFAFGAFRKLGWKAMGFGALAWVGSVALKFVAAYAINGFLYKILVGDGDIYSPGAILFDVYVGFLTGFFEVLLVWVLVRFSKVEKQNWNKALGFGIGFGAVEALLLGVVSLVGTVAALANPSVLPLAGIENLARASNFFYSLAPIVERVFTIFIHILANVLLFYAAARRKAIFMWVAVIYKTLIDSVAAYAQLANVTVSLEGIWMIEAVVILFGLIGLMGTLRLSRYYEERG